MRIYENVFSRWIITCYVRKFAVSMSFLFESCYITFIKNLFFWFVFWSKILIVAKNVITNYMIKIAPHKKVQQLITIHIIQPTDFLEPVINYFWIAYIISGFVKFWSFWNHNVECSFMTFLKTYTKKNNSKINETDRIYKKVWEKNQNISKHHIIINQTSRMTRLYTLLMQYVHKCMYCVICSLHRMNDHL